MAAGQYSAGTVFLQVVPSYKNFMRKLRDDLNGPLQKAMEQEADALMEKAGIQGGKKYAEGVQKGVQDKIKRGAFATDAIKSLDKALEKLGPTASGVRAKMEALRNDFEKGKRSSNELADELYEVNAMLEEIGKRNENIDIRTNAGAAARELDRVSSAARSSARESEGAARAAKNLGSEHRRGARAANDADKSTGGLRARMFGLVNGTNDAANSFRFFNFAILAASTVGPALIPILAGIAGGLAALGVSALASAAALGVTFLALSGISGAVQAMGAAQKSGGRDAAAYGRAQQSAARQVADARRAVADARRSAAEGVRRALESERQAEMRLADAQRDAKRAQQELTQARKEAKEELMDLADQVAQNQLDERQGVIDLFNAYTTYGATMADGGSTNLEKEQADVNLQQAELNLKRIRDEQVKLGEAKAKADKEGINGTNTMIAAQDRVTSAVEREKEARLDLKEASRDVDLARQDGARRVADAQRMLNRAIEDQRNVTQQTSAAVDNLNDAMKNLSPAQRRFAEFIFSLREGFFELRAIAAEDFLPGLQRGMERIINHYGPGFKGFVGEMGASLGRLSEEWAKSFTSRPWRGFFRDFREAAVGMNEDLARGFMGFGEGLAEFFRLGIPTAQKFAHWIKEIGRSFSTWTQSKEGQKDIREFWDYVERVGPKVKDFFVAFGRFLVGLGKALAPVGETILDGLTKFFNYVSKMDPTLLTALAGGLLGVVAALQISTGIVSLVSIITIIGGSAFIAGVAAISLLAAGLFLLFSRGDKASGTMGKLRDALQPVLKIFKELGQYIGEKFKQLWEDLQPSFESLANTITQTFLPAFEKFWPVIKPIVHFLIDVVFGIIKGFVQGLIDVVEGVIKVLSGFMMLLSGDISGGLKKIFGGLFQAIWGIVQLFVFGKIFGGLKKVFGKWLPDLFKGAGKLFQRLIEKPFDLISRFFMSFISGALKRFRNLRDDLGSIFSAIGNFIGKKMGNPIMTVVDVVLNKGLIKGANNLLGWLGLKTRVGTLPIKKFATGGVLPGYTPGRDVHQFYSPTGGQLHLSGGEAIMRPEWTKAVGGQAAVERMNRAAMRGQAFASGGVVMPLKGSKAWTTYPGHTGIDFGRASGTPVYAATSGRITSAPRWGYSYGNHINLQGGGYRQIYAHLSAILAKVGATVAKGQMIGRVGSTGNSTGPHLHFEVRPGGTTGSAAAFLRGAGVPSGKAIPSIWDKLGSGAVKALANPIGYLKGLVDFGGIGGLTGGMGSMLKAIPGKLYDDIFDWIKEKGAKILGVTGKFFGSAASKISDVFGFLGGGGRPNGYTKPKLYDQGGYLPPGYTTVLNNTGRPEPVLSAPQWDKIMAGKGGGDTYQINVPVKTNASGEEIAEAIVFEIKRASRRR